MADQILYYKYVDVYLPKYDEKTKEFNQVLMTTTFRSHLFPIGMESAIDPHEIRAQLRDLGWDIKVISKNTCFKIKFFSFQLYLNM